jgi:hypothetical protein
MRSLKNTECIFPISSAEICIIPRQRARSTASTSADNLSAAVQQQSQRATMPFRMHYSIAIAGTRKGGYPREGKEDTKCISLNGSGTFAHLNPAIVGPPANF